MSVRSLITFGRSAALAFGVVVLVAAIAGLAQGYRGFTVLSGSMAPALPVGDLVLSEQIAPADARPGNVVTFSDPDDPTRLITHRVRSIDAADGVVSFVTKGDANNTTERWQVSEEARIGRMAGQVPFGGYAMQWLRGPGGKLLFIVVPALLLGAAELRRVWRAPRPTEEHPAPA